MITYIDANAAKFYQLGDAAGDVYLNPVMTPLSNVTLTIDEVEYRVAAYVIQQPSKERLLLEKYVNANEGKFDAIFSNFHRGTRMVRMSTYAIVVSDATGESKSCLVTYDSTDEKGKEKLLVKELKHNVIVNHHPENLTEEVIDILESLYDLGTIDGLLYIKMLNRVSCYSDPILRVVSTSDMHVLPMSSLAITTDDFKAITDLIWEC